jgi:hypothetical protein
MAPRATKPDEDTPHVGSRLPPCRRSYARRYLHNRSLTIAARKPVLSRAREQAVAVSSQGVPCVIL